jgi:hypothetical protein
LLQSHTERLKPSDALCWGLIAFLFVFGLLYPSFSDEIHRRDVHQLTRSAIASLDETSHYFDDLRCSPYDSFCWWFLFHLSIGETGNKAMRHFAQRVPYKADGTFVGEAHVSQYSAYWFLKGIPSDTTLSTGETFNEHMYSTDWKNLFRQSTDKEPSWYLISEAFAPDLPKISPRYEKEKSCMGSHYLIGLYADKSNRKLYESYLQDYYYRVYEVLNVHPSQALTDETKSDLILHSFESFCLTGQKHLISKELFYYSIDLLNLYLKQLKQKMDQYPDPNSLIANDSEFIFLSGEVFGHFRNGLKVCSGVEQNRIVNE